MSEEEIVKRVPVAIDGEIYYLATIVPPDKAEKLWTAKDCFYCKTNLEFAKKHGLRAIVANSGHVWGVEINEEVKE